LSLETGRYQLFSAFKTLAAHWDRTKLSWDDKVRKDFEEQQWAALEYQINATMTAIDRLGQVMNACRQQCSGSDFWNE
jgi:hypothetical protein